MGKQYKITEETDFVEEAPTSFYIDEIATPLVEMTSYQKMNIVRGGVTKSYLVKLKDEASLDYDNLAQALSVTRSTLINKKGTQKYSEQLGERIISLADLYSFGYEVFEDKAKFNKWMLTPNQALGGQAPFDIIDNQYGREEVRNTIGRIAYGVFS